MGNVRTVLHVGAHEAQELRAYELLGARYIVWVEADPRKAAQLKARGLTAFQFAASDQEGWADFHLFSRSMANSLLPAAREEGEARMLGETVRVPTMRLDSLCVLPDLLVLDVQGAELAALRGAEEVLKFVSMVVVEAYEANHPYQGAPLAHEIGEFLVQRGFELATAIDRGWEFRDLVYRRSGGRIGAQEATQIAEVLDREGRSAPPLAQRAPS